MNRQKKTRGLKRRYKQLEKICNIISPINKSHLSEYEFDYIRARSVPPWPWNINGMHLPMPVEFEMLIISWLMNQYRTWKEDLNENFDEYYLKIFLYDSPDVPGSDTQVVCAVGEQINKYKNAFMDPIADKHQPFDRWKKLKTQLIDFDWTQKLEVEFEMEEDYEDDPKTWKKLQLKAIEKQNGGIIIPKRTLWEGSLKK